VFYLKDKRCYLSGAIEYSQEDNWRNLPKQILKDRFNVNVFDPFEDPKQQWSPLLKKAKEDKNYDAIIKITHDFVRKDLSMVDHSHFLIAYLPHKVPTTGTVHEIINSNNAKKPTLLVTDSNDITNIPLWYWGFISPEFMFPNWDALFKYLKEVDDGFHQTNRRWNLVHGLI
jgi:hypothetical protein